MLKLNTGLYFKFYLIHFDLYTNNISNISVCKIQYTAFEPTKFYFGGVLTNTLPCKKQNLKTTLRSVKRKKIEVVVSHHNEGM